MLAEEFPALANIGVYFDSAATTQKPRAVIKCMCNTYEKGMANVHRGSYPLAEDFTWAYERAREAIGAFVRCPKEQVAFTMNATDSLNQAITLVSRRFFRPGMNAITTSLEHNSAYLPLLRQCRSSSMDLRVIGIDEQGDSNLGDLERLVDSKTACAVLTLGSNVTGWSFPVDALKKLEAFGVPVILDASQAVPHQQVDFEALGCDFLCFSSHKLYGPSGLGIMCCKTDWLQEEGVRLGGGTVEQVDLCCYRTFSDVRALEAGTGPLEQVLGLEAAIHFLEDAGLSIVHDHEWNLCRTFMDGLKSIRGFRILGNTDYRRLPVVSFLYDAMHPVDLGKLLALKGFCLRSGRHCAFIYHDALELSGSLRASFALYNSIDEVNSLLDCLQNIAKRWKN